VLFVDADCRLDPNCLAALRSTIGSFPSAQLLSASADWELLQRGWKAEELRLVTFQEHALQPDGRIRYLTPPDSPCAANGSAAKPECLMRPRFG